MRRFVFAALVLCLIAALATAGAFFWGVYHFRAPGPLSSPKLMVVESGASMRVIARNLAYEGVIRHPVVFMIAARLTGVDDKLQAGEYQFPPHMSQEEILDRLVIGRTHQRALTIPEGLTSAEIVDVINKADALVGRLETIPPEGSLLPETYYYTRWVSRDEVLSRLHRAMTDTLAQLWDGRAKDLPIVTMQQAVTLASIVEKETAIPAERARVAGVFVNRLKKGIPLQSDPTVIYALTQGQEKLGRSLTYNDLERRSPYNTYIVRGLPPGPICNPGRESLKATLNPEDHDYLYFVADGNGGHVFAKTLDEHNANVARWRQIQKSRKNDAKTQD